MRPGVCSLSSFRSPDIHNTPELLRPEGVGHKEMLAGRLVPDIKQVSIIDEFWMKNDYARRVSPSPGIGSSTTKVVPLVGSLTTDTVPPCASATYLTIASPHPGPAGRLARADSPR